MSHPPFRPSMRLLTQSLSGVFGLKRGHEVRRFEFSWVNASSLAHEKRERQVWVRLWDLDVPPKQASDCISNIPTEAFDAAASAASALFPTSITRERLNLPTESLSSCQRGSRLREAISRNTFPRRLTRAPGRDARFFLLMNHTEIVKLEVETQTERRCLSGHTGAIMWAKTSAASRRRLGTRLFSPDGRLVAAERGQWPSRLACQNRGSSYTH
ncbi:hypothetical protein R3P38DRAFT_3520401 [Favolaschia claudopus]|uniref:Uncharacterized protein n=1 Tax=Favolaschia claudopus TaxID=2862362 RepID=A0AAW0BML1_9AGAR